MTPGLISAMEKGQFYATTGVMLEKIEFIDNVLSIKVLEQEDVTYAISFIGYKRDRSNSEVLLNISGLEAEYQLSDDILFVRAKITSSKRQNNPVESMKYEMAWTQPVVPDSN